MQLELRRLVALNPNVQFAIRRVFSEDIIADIERKERKKEEKNAHLIYNLTCV